MNKAAQAYFQTKVSTTDQGQLLLLLYDGALKYLQQAREKMLINDYAAKGIFISKVLDIINELTNTLNLEKGGSLAENLNNLYFLCTTRLLQANLKMNVEQLDNVASILSGLRSAYAEIIETPEARKASAQISARLNVDATLTQRAAIQTTNTTAPTSLGKMQARNAYGAMQKAMPSTPVSSPSTPSTQSAPVSGIAAVMGQNAIKNAVDEAASAAKSATIPFNAVQSEDAVPAESNAAAPVSTAPHAPASPSNPASPTKGFGVSGFSYPKAFGK